MVSLSTLSGSFHCNPPYLQTSLASTTGSAFFVSLSSQLYFHARKIIFASLSPVRNSVSIPQLSNLSVEKSSSSHNHQARVNLSRCCAALLAQWWPTIVVIFAARSWSVRFLVGVTIFFVSFQDRSAEPIPGIFDNTMQAS